MISLICAVVCAAQDEEYRAAARALDALEEAAGAVEEMERQAAEHEAELFRWTRGMDGWELNRRRMKEWQERNAAIHAELSRRRDTLSTRRDEATRALASFRNAMKPCDDLRRMALEHYRQIQAGGKDPSNRRRALAAIVTGLDEMSRGMLGNRVKIVDAAERLLRAARPLEEIRAQIVGLVEDDADKSFADWILSLVGDALQGGAPERIEKFQSGLGRAGQILSLWRALQNGSGGAAEIDRLINIVDVVSGLLPEEYGPASVYAAYLKKCLEVIHGGMRRLNLEIARQNLRGLDAIACGRDTRVAGDVWTGLNPNAPFGTIPPEPSLRTAKREFAPGETIRVDYEGSFRYTGWIGLVPPHVAHGDEETCDEHDVEYARMGTATGSVELTAPGTPGSWTIRMFDHESGAEVASIQIEVVKNGVVLRLAKHEFLPGETISIEYAARDASICLAESDLAHGTTDSSRFRRVYILYRSSGTQEAYAPGIPGTYDLRLVGATEEMASVTFRVLAAPPGLTTDKTEYRAGETIIIRWNLPEAPDGWIHVTKTPVMWGGRNPQDCYRAAAPPAGTYEIRIGEHRVSITVK